MLDTFLPLLTQEVSPPVMLASYAINYARSVNFDNDTCNDIISSTKPRPPLYPVSL
jgi:hypothetical protein